jgi:hypothetical protein
LALTVSGRGRETEGAEGRWWVSGHSALFIKKPMNCNIEDATNDPVAGKPMLMWKQNEQCGALQSRAEVTTS